MKPFIAPRKRSTQKAIRRKSQRPSLEVLEDRLNLTFVFPAHDLPVVEVDGHATIDAFRQRLDPQTTGTVKYATKDGTAKAGVDYTATSGTLIFPPGDYNERIHVPIADSLAVNHLRAFTVVLTDSGTGAVLDTATVTIIDDEAPIDASTLSTPNYVSVPDKGANTLQYAPDGSLVQLLWLNSASGDGQNDFQTRLTFLRSDASGYGNPEVILTPVYGHPQLILDSAGTPHVLIANDTTGQLVHFRRDASGWNQVETVTVPLPSRNDGFDILEKMTAAIGPDDSLHVLVVGGGAKSLVLVYGTNKGGSWAFQKVADLGNQDNRAREPLFTRNLSLAIDSQGFAHAAFSPELMAIPVPGTQWAHAFSQLAYATNRSGAWITQIVFQPPDYGNAGTEATIAVGPGDQVAIASFYVREVLTGSALFGQLLYHTRQADGTWATEVVASTPDGYAAGDGARFTGFAPLLRFDTLAQPHIVFSDFASQHLPDVGQVAWAGQIRHATRVNGNWQVETVLHQTNPLANGMRAPTMAISPSGMAAFSGLRETYQVIVDPFVGEPINANYTTTYGVVTESLVGQIQLSAGAYSVCDKGGSLTVLVTRTKGNLGTATVDYATADGSAHAGLDYTTTTGTLTFLPGETTKTITIPILDDGRADGNETFSITLSNTGNGATLGSQATAVLTTADVLAPPANLLFVANLLTHSPEQYAYFITQAYKNYLGRAPDASGLAFWVGVMRGGFTDERLEAGFLGSAEYIANHGGQGQGWVEGMYNDLLGRKPDAAGEAFWVQALASGGLTAAQVAFGFAASAERETMRINGDYQAYLGRAPDPGGLSFWLNGFLHGATNEDLVAGFLASPEYYLSSSKGHGNKAGWVPSAYLDALHRPAGPDEILFWTSVLEGS